jgi:enoyl-CoA hydratase/carnithine racemase
MSDIITERSATILRIQLNRPAKRNAMTSGMYLIMTDLLNSAAIDDSISVVLWHSAGDSFCAGNDIEDFLNNPPSAGESPQARFIDALLNFDKPIVAAVQGMAIGGGTTMLTHCDFIYAGESAKFQMPFINLGLVPEFGSTCSVPANAGYVRAAELILLGEPFDASRAAQLGLVTQVIPDEVLLITASETAQKLAQKPAGALQACKRLMKWSTRQQVEDAMRAENDEFASRLRSLEAREAMRALLDKGQPDFTRTTETVRTSERLLTERRFP